MKNQKELPKPLPDLPLPEKDLPLPEKELTSNASESVASEPEKPHRLSRLLLSFLFGFLFVVLVVIIGGGAFIIGKNSKSENQQVVQTQVSTPSPTPDPIADWVITDSAIKPGWKIYTNTNYGYSLEVPSDWKLKNPTTDDPYIYFYSPERFGNELNYFIFSRHLVNKNQLTFKDFATEIWPDDIKDNFKFTTEKLNGNTIYKTESLPSIAGCLEAYITNDDVNFANITLCPFSSEKPFREQNKYLNIYNQIISTFKFADSGSPTIVSSADKFCPNPEGMSYEEALEIAQNSECSEQGTLLTTKQCNPSGTGYWWIDYKPHVPKSGCRPACVVDVEAKKAEINWRCTGLVAPN